MSDQGRRLKILITLIGMSFIALGLKLGNIWLVALASVLFGGCLLYLNFAKDDGEFKKFVSEVSSEDPLKFLTKSIFKIPGILAVEVNLAEGLESQTFKSFVFGAPSDKANVAVFGLAISDINFGNFKIFSKNRLSDFYLKQIEEVSYKLVVAMIIGHLRTEILRFKKLSEQSIKARTGFLANLSHEIRGPLGNIINAVEMIIEESAGQDSVLELANIAVSNSRHLLTLINDILEFAKTEGNVSPRKEPLLLEENLLETVNLIRSFANKRNVKIELNLGLANSRILCDRTHFRQIIINLLSNGIKYNREGGIVSIEGKIEGKRAEISIRDTGYGISPEFMPKLFEPFEREPSAVVESQVGTGLGLALVKKLVQLNGGFIEVDSEVGKGSVFTVGFPLTDLEPKVDEKSKRFDVNGKGATLLVAESLLSSARPFIRFCAQKNFRISFAKSIEEMFSFINSSVVSCVLVDESFLRSRRLEFFEVIKALPRGKTLPLCLISSRSFDFEIQSDVKSGFDLCLVQPFDLHDAGFAICELIEKFRGLKSEA
ncbi:MAG: HAMP domain-containing histidine kinase [Deltaproteobacteria bacterium]|nr:HAMP domain-containing histidine kinase [Deltaproteobacteria bacterium]